MFSKHLSAMWKVSTICSQVKILNFDQGSIEAVRRALQVLPQTNVTLKFLLQATGDVSTSDVDLAVASKAIIFGFNVKATGSIKSYADNKGVEIRLYRVIYELIDDVRNAMEGLLEPVEVTMFLYPILGLPFLITRVSLVGKRLHDWMNVFGLF